MLYDPATKHTPTSVLIRILREVKETLAIQKYFDYNIDIKKAPTPKVDASR